MSDSVLNMWTVYDHPRDRPEAFVARRSEISAGTATMTNDVVTAPTLEELRRRLPPGLCCIARSVQDDPVIVEVWL